MRGASADRGRRFRRARPLPATDVHRVGVVHASGGKPRNSRWTRGHGLSAGIEHQSRGSGGVPSVLPGADHVPGAAHVGDRGHVHSGGGRGYRARESDGGVRRPVRQARASARPGARQGRDGPAVERRDDRAAIA